MKLRDWGWPGMATLLLLLLAGPAAYFGHHLALRTQDAERRIQMLEQALKQQAFLPPPPISTREDWLKQLPDSTLRQHRLADLLEISIRQGLNVNRIEPKLSTDSAAGLERMRVIMPLQAGYAQIRGFIGAALQHDAALSLDSLKLRRTTPQANSVEAELVWSLHGRLPQESP